MNDFIPDLLRCVPYFFQFLQIDYGVAEYLPKKQTLLETHGLKQTLKKIALQRNKSDHARQDQRASDFFLPDTSGAFR